MAAGALEFAEVSAKKDAAYAARVRESIVAMRKRMGMSQSEFAAALSAELGRTISITKISQWENGSFAPYSPTYHAMIAISGARLKEDLGIDPVEALAKRVNEQQQRLRELRGYSGRLYGLPDADGPIEDWLSVAETARTLELSRQGVYGLRDRGLLHPYRLGLHAVYRRQEVETLRRQRESRA